MNLIKTFWNNGGYNLASMNMEEEYMTVEKLQEIFGEWPLRVGKFEKVSYEQFRKDWLNTYSKPGDEELRNEEAIKDAYDTLNLPTRATFGSGGYDFFSPLDFVLGPDEDIMIPTGIRIKLLPGFRLSFYPKSGLGSKYFLRIANTIPTIDEDYYYSDNMGHIFLRIRNEGNKRVVINKGDKYIQGIIEMFGLDVNDNATGVRNGGFGSTGK